MDAPREAPRNGRMDPNSAGERRRRRLVMAVCFFSILPLLIVSGASVWQYDRAFEAGVLRELGRAAAGRSRETDAFLRTAEGAVEQMAGSHTLEEMIDPESTAALLAMLQRSHPGVFVDLGLVDDQGKLISYAGPFALGKVEYAKESWFTSGLSEAVRVSDVFLGFRGSPHFVVTVRKRAEGRNYVLRAGVDFARFTRVVEEFGAGLPWAVFIINDKGEFQTGAGPDLFGEAREFIPFFDSKTRTRPFGTPFFADHGFGETVYVTLPVNHGRWLMIARLDRKDALRPVFRARDWAVVVILIGALLVLLIKMAFSRRILEMLAPVQEESGQMSDQVIEAGKLAAVGELAAGIAHEINNPVAVMKEEAGWIGDLLDEPWFREREESKEVFEALDQIQAQGVRCREITQKLLSFARKTDPTIKKVCLNNLMEEMAALSERKARYGNVKMTMNLADGLPAVKASPSELNQVFLNLINNAVDAMEKNKGGEITLTTAADGEFVKVSVADTGEGIPESYLAKVFDPFYTTKPVGKGTGLGLSICYGIVDKLGGTISVKSALGRGTTFTIRLPADPDSTCICGEESPCVDDVGRDTPSTTFATEPPSPTKEPTKGPAEEPVEKSAEEKSHE